MNHPTLWCGGWLLALAGSLPVWAQNAPANNARAQIHYQVQPTKLKLIPPGTVIEKTAPKPWTHLLVKSHPRAAAGDLNKVSDTDKYYAKLLSTTMLALVEPVKDGNRVRYRLKHVAGGVSKNINGKDTVISPDTQGRLGANLGILGSIVLREFHSKQASVTLPVRSETFALLDTPIVVRHQNRNDPMVLRYAVVVDSQSGRLDTLCWLVDIDDNQKYQGTVGHLQWLPSDLVMDCPLYVDSSHYVLGIPKDTAFAVVQPPQGQVRIQIRPDAAGLLAKPEMTAAEAAALDGWFRTVIRQAAAARQHPAQ